MQRIGPREPRHKKMPQLAPPEHPVKSPAIDMQHDKPAEHEEQVYHQVRLFEEHRRRGRNEPAYSHLEMEHGHQDRCKTAQGS